MWRCVTRSAQAELKKDDGSAKGWARCVQLIDLNAGRTEGKVRLGRRFLRARRSSFGCVALVSFGQDVSRMRKILLEAKHGGLPLRAS